VNRDRNTSIFQQAKLLNKYDKEASMSSKFNSRKYILVWVAVVALLILAAVPVSAQGFVHGIVIEVDGEDYYLDGPDDGPNGEKDVPGHYWVQAGPDKVVGKHYNTGPSGASQWWSSDAPDGELLYIVKGIIDTWSVEKKDQYAARGYVHYHELVTVANGTPHPDKVLWLKHTARTSFTLDGGPDAPNPPYEHEVTPGVDYEFPNNYFIPYGS
jgi:selenium-binding protein 1